MFEPRKGHSFLITLIVMLTLAMALDCSFAAGVQGEKVIVQSRYLLLDSRVIDRTQNAKLTLGKVKKHPANPLFGEDKPWEPRYDNVYANVIYDQQDKLYKCWYSPFIIDKRTTSTPEGKRNPYDQDYMGARPNDREMGVCYATSKDGINWDKPKLGLVEFEGNKKNNILMRGHHFEGVFHGPHGAGVFKDNHESDPAKRYKMFFKGSKMAVSFSADGLHWSQPIQCPQIDAHGDTHNNAFWAPDTGKYIGITRLKYDRPSIRQVAWTGSKDFVNWSKAKVVLEGVNPLLQTHDMVVFPTGRVYIGLLGMMEFQDRSNFHVKQHIELAWSPDTITWHRIEEGKPFIGHSSAKKEYYGKTPYDWGTNFASTPIFLEGEVRIYYGACDWYFFDWRKGYLALATLRPDGWAGYESESGDAPAVIITKPVPCRFENICVTADVGDGGSVTVAVVDSKGSELISSEPITRTVTDYKVKWKVDSDNNALKSDKISLKFTIQNAKLYSFIDDAPAVDEKDTLTEKLPEKTILFERGKGGYNNYRIPSLIVSKKGTLLAFCEGREAGDAGDIDILLRRSEDGGKHWSQKQVVWSDARNTCGNPCPVVDQNTGRIWLMTTWNLGTDHEGDIIGWKSKDVRKPYVCYSDDDGETWSSPVDISETARREDWRWYATGPGNGVQIQNGQYKGRLVIPANHSYNETRNDVYRKSRKYGYGSHVIYSDDHGKNWKISESITPGCNESTIAELSDSRLMMNMRSYNGQKSRAISISRDGGTTWSPIKHDPALIEPVCQASLVSYRCRDNDNKNLLLFSNPANTSGRSKLTIRVSSDNGKTWPVAKQFHAGPAAYSSLAVLPNGDIGCFYEGGVKSAYETIIFKVFSMESLSE